MAGGGAEGHKHLVHDTPSTVISVEPILSFAGKGTPYPQAVASKMAVTMPL